MMTKEQRQKYNRDNYRKNRRRILSHRNRRYRQDPAYREAILYSSKMSTALHTVVSRARRKTVVTHNGKRERGYLLPDIARVVRRSIMTVYWWRQNGMLPNGYTVRNENVYAWSQVMYIKQLFDWYDDASEEWQTRVFGAILRRVWNSTFDEGVLNKIILEAMEGE